MTRSAEKHGVGRAVGGSQEVEFRQQYARLTVLHRDHEVLELEITVHSAHLMEVIYRQTDFRQQLRGMFAERCRAKRLPGLLWEERILDIETAAVNAFAAGQQKVAPREALLLCERRSQDQGESVGAQSRLW